MMATSKAKRVIKKKIAPGAQTSVEENDPILQMRGLGKEIWADTNADEYVASLRTGWNAKAPAIMKSKRRHRAKAASVL